VGLGDGDGELVSVGVAEGGGVDVGVIVSPGSGVRLGGGVSLAGGVREARAPTNVGVARGVSVTSSKATFVAKGAFSLVHPTLQILSATSANCHHLLA